MLISDGDPTRAGQAFAREVAAVLPRPLPEVDALLRAHIKRLAGFRRARTRGLLVLNAFAGIKDELGARGAGAGRRAGRAGARGAGAIRRSSCWATPSWRAAAGRAGATSANPDAAVVERRRDEALDTRLGEARARAPGAALVVVDAAPVDRAAGGGHLRRRARLPAARALELLGRVAASAAARRHGESTGVRIVEALARHGVLTGAERNAHPDAAAATSTRA